MDRDGLPVCGDCVNCNNSMCDYNGKLVFEDDDPKEKCNFEGFKRIETGYRRRS